MKNDNSVLRRAVALALLLPAYAAWGQEEAAEAGQPAAQAQEQEAIEEVVVLGRFLTAAESLVTERITVPFSADFLGADVIARAGDPDIASALRRVPGLTVVDGKFVYVRGLGERYSSVTVNGAAVPSPELTRSVIPLDLFPTSIVESIKIQKSPSPDQPASFGGGAIDIRTTGIPVDIVAEASIGLGFNNESDKDGLLHPGSGSPLPSAIVNAINAYQGDISVSNIFNALRQNDPLVPLTEAQAIHQSLIDSLDTNVAARSGSLDPDTGFKVALGNSWDLNQDWRFGALFNATYDDKYRNENQFREGVSNPDGIFFDIERTIYEERTVGALGLGLEYLGDHMLEFASYKIDNDEIEARIQRGFDANNPPPDDQRIDYSSRIEERELTLNQISGSHTFEDDSWMRTVLQNVALEDLQVDWFYSESEATTDIPNQTNFQAGAVLDSDTGETISTQLNATTSAGTFNFLNLIDNQDSWGGNLVLPVELDNAYMTLSGGWWGTQKDRDYRGYNVNLNAVGVPIDVRAGDPGDFLASGNLIVGNGYDLSLGTQFGTESYVAAQQIDAFYGMVDTDFNNNWRFTIGARYEDYRQTVLPIDLLDFTGNSTQSLIDQLQDPNQTLAIQDDDVFGSVALTYTADGWLGADQQQIRISYGETIVRPDLREVADVIYIDPELNVRVQGNPGLRSSPIDNFEIRSEFFYGSGDNFTVSLFFKDVLEPIELIRSQGSDDDYVLGFTNAESGEVSGLEFEGLKSLPNGFFLTGNLTLSDSEVVLPAGLSTSLTNLTRRMTGHSEWVVNTTLGYDAPSGRHSAYLNFNAFGERIYFAGVDQHDDVYEQPFDSLGVVYKYFPTDRIEIEVKVDNILDEQREFEQISSTGEVARIISQTIGTSMSLSGRFSF